MIAEMITVGTELLRGQIFNANIRLAVNELTALGIEHYIQTTTDEKPEHLCALTAQAEKRADIIIYSGVSTPTTHKNIVETISAYLQVDSVYEEYFLPEAALLNARHSAKISHHSLAITADVNGGHILKNSQGELLAMIIIKDDHLYIILPGLVNENISLVIDYLKPYLREKTLPSSASAAEYIHFFGISKAVLQHDLKILTDEYSDLTLQVDGADTDLTLHLMIKAPTEQEAAMLLAQITATIYKNFAQHVYGQGQNYTLANAAVDFLKAKHLTIGFAESLTGGLAASQMVAVTGASEIFRGSIVAYDAEAKANLLGVSPEILASEGMVSDACALAMAEGALSRLKTDLAISLTGVAGPDKMENKPVGTVFVGIARKDQPATVMALQLSGPRQQIREQAVKAAFMEIIS